MLSKLSKPIMAILMVMTASVALASETERLMELLIAKGILTAEEAEAIRSEAAEEKEEKKVKLVGSELGYEPTAPLSDDDVSIQVPRFAAESADGANRFRMRGRLQLDAARQDFGSGIKDVARQGHDFPEYGVILRRVRLGALGIMRERWEWQIEADFAENEVDLANVYMAYLMDHGRLALGYFKEPFGMEYATSSRYISFIERSAPADAYKVNREPGLMYETLQPNWYLGVGVFGNGIDFDREIREGWAFSARTSFAPVLGNDRFVHIGGGLNRRVNALDKDSNEFESVRLRAREGTRAIDARLVGRDDIEGVKNFTRYNLEFAAGYGPWWMQSEYYRVDLNLDPDRGDVRVDDDSLTLDGWFIQTGFFLTGETKNYRAFSGDFGQQRPNRNFSPRDGNWGAFEVAFRYGLADSREHSRPGRGQKLERYTAGLNWYLNPEVLMRFNVIYLEGERDVFQDDGWVYGFRFQYIF
jgi:phosphate-selective porin OprO and OprP